VTARRQAATQSIAKLLSDASGAIRKTANRWVEHGSKMDVAALLKNRPIFPRVGGKTFSGESTPAFRMTASWRTPLL